MEQTIFSVADLGHIWPEIILFIGSGAVLLKDAFSPNDKTKHGSYVLAQVVFVLALVMSLFSTPTDGVLLQGHFINDPIGVFSRTAILIVSIFTLAYAKDFLIGHEIYKSEFYVLVMLSVLGMLVMVNAQSLLTLYLGIEMLALSTYVLTAFDRDSDRGSEAAMKYFILGSVASGLILYGMSMAYGAAGSLDLAQIAAHTGMVVQQGSLSSDLPLLLAMVFLLSGILFKLGAAPFHMWIPDVYQGAPAGSVAVMSAAPKIAYLVLLIRLVMGGFGDAEAEWRPILIIVALLSIVIGNLIAIIQTEIKRLFAYSTVSHIGFMLLGLAAAGSGTNGLSTAYFYIIAYALAAAAAMAIVVAISKSEGVNGDVKIASLSGLMKQAPGLALVLLISIVSMAGIPVSIGFFAKLGIMTELIKADLIWLAVIAVIFAVIGAYYYLRVIKVACFDEVPEEPTRLLPLALDTKVLLFLNTILILGLTFFPQKLFNLCQALF